MVAIKLKAAARLDFVCLAPVGAARNNAGVVRRVAPAFGERDLVVHLAGVVLLEAGPPPRRVAHGPALPLDWQAVKVGVLLLVVARLHCKDNPSGLSGGYRGATAHGRRRGPAQCIGTKYSVALVAPARVTSK